MHHRMTSSLQRAKFIPVLLGMVVLGATVARAALSSHAAVSSTMHAYVHEDNSIGITFDDGSAVGSQARTPPTIPPGTYTIRVVDDAFEHNIHLSGPGVDVATVVDGTASPTWTVTFQAGSTYKFQCDTHFDFMYGLFQTSGTSSGGSSSGGGSSGGSSSGGSTSVGTAGTGAVFRGTLAGTVGAGGALKLALKGKAVSKLKAGRYEVTVVDKTRARSFVVQQTKHAAITVTGVSFVGTRSKTVNFKVGAWSYFTSAGLKSKTAFTVVA
jgi:hypothetical protein